MSLVAKTKQEQQTLPASHYSDAKPQIRHKILPAAVKKFNRKETDDEFLRMYKESFVPLTSQSSRKQPNKNAQIKFP